MSRFSDLTDQQKAEAAKFFLMEHLEYFDPNKVHDDLVSKTEMKDIGYLTKEISDDSKEVTKLVETILLISDTDFPDKLDIAIQASGKKQELITGQALLALTGMALMFIYSYVHLQKTRGVKEETRKRKIKKKGDGFLIEEEVHKVYIDNKSPFGSFLGKLFGKGDSNE